MSNKELNRAILEKLYEQVYRRIDQWHLPDGEYTCGMIEEYVREQIGKKQGAFLKGLDRASNMIRAYGFLCGQVDWLHDSIEKLRAKEIRIQVGDFKCSLLEESLVTITLKFERLCNVSAPDRQRFYKETVSGYETENNQRTLSAVG